MTDELTRRRRFFAEEVQAVCSIRTTALVDALAAVPREQFLRPGPWLIRGEVEVGLRLSKNEGGGEWKYIYKLVFIN